MGWLYGQVTVIPVMQIERRVVEILVGVANPGRVGYYSWRKQWQDETEEDHR